MKLNEENKIVKEFSDKYFDYGVHKVLVGDVTLGGTAEGEKEYIEVEVIDPGDLDITDKVRVWFTTDKAINYSFNLLRQIFVHCAPEDKKDDAKIMFDQIGDTDTLKQIMEKCKGRQIWFTKYPDPSRPYTNPAGETKPGISKNIMGYEPKLKPELLPKDGKVNLDALGIGTEVKDVPFESKGDAPGSKATNTVPSSDAWA
jgi:hypothetical protein